MARKPPKKKTAKKRAVSRKKPAAKTKKATRATTKPKVRTRKPAAPRRPARAPRRMMVALPPGHQIQADAAAALVEAMRSVLDEEIATTTVPSEPPFGFQLEGWGMCLADFAARLKAFKGVYAPYRHQPIYAQETLEEPFSAILIYLKTKVIEQIS